MPSDRPRVLIAGLFHETNTFLVGTTPLADFAIADGDTLLAQAGDPSPMGGVLTAAGRLGWEIVPGIDLRAMPSALVERNVVDTFEVQMRATVERAAGGGIDGVCLVLHGAMVAEDLPDVEGQVLATLRSIPALTNKPIAVVLDLHANIGPQTVAGADVVRAYRTNPHVDGWQCGVDTAELLNRLLRRGRRGLVRHRGPGIVWAPTATGTDSDPMATLEQMARDAEKGNPDFLSVDVLAGFAYADVPDCGVAFTVSTLGDTEAADLVLENLCACAWELRGPREVAEPDVRTVLSQLAAEFPDGDGPVLLEEPADNIGGGAPGDTTELLSALLEFDLPGSACVINDLDAVMQLADVAIGSRVRVAVGGKSGAPGATDAVWMDAELVSRSDGRFALDDPQSHLASMGGSQIDMGPCVVLRQGNTTVLVTSHKTPPFDLGQWRSQGIAPETLRIVGIKAAVAHRRAWDPICRTRIRVSTAGPCAADLRTLPYASVRRPVFPLDG